MENRHEKIIARLKSIEGHVRGVQRMVEEGHYCVDILKQTQAIQAAVDKVNALILENHLENCVTNAIRGEEVAERERVIAELIDLFSASRRG